MRLTDHTLRSSSATRYGSRLMVLAVVLAACATLVASCSSSPDETAGRDERAEATSKATVPGGPSTFVDSQDVRLGRPVLSGPARARTDCVVSQLPSGFRLRNMESNVDLGPGDGLAFRESQALRVYFHDGRGQLAPGPIQIRCAFPGVAGDVIYVLGFRGDAVPGTRQDAGSIIRDGFTITDETTFDSALSRLTPLTLLATAGWLGFGFLLGTLRPRAARYFTRLRERVPARGASSGPGGASGSADQDGGDLPDGANPPAEGDARVNAGESSTPAPGAIDRDALSRIMESLERIESGIAGFQSRASVSPPREVVTKADLEQGLDALATRIKEIVPSRNSLGAGDTPASPAIQQESSGPVASVSDRHSEAGEMKPEAAREAPARASSVTPPELEALELLRDALRAMPSRREPARAAGEFLRAARGIGTFCTVAEGAGAPTSRHTSELVTDLRDVQARFLFTANGLLRSTRPVITVVEPSHTPEVVLRAVAAEVGRSSPSDPGADIRNVVGKHKEAIRELSELRIRNHTDWAEKLAKSPSIDLFTAEPNDALEEATHYAKDTFTSGAVDEPVRPGARIAGVVVLPAVVTTKG